MFWRFVYSLRLLHGFCVFLFLCSFMFSLCLVVSIIVLGWIRTFLFVILVFVLVLTLLAVLPDDFNLGLLWGLVFILNFITYLKNKKLAHFNHSLNTDTNRSTNCKLRYKCKKRKLKALL